ncbi:hypothetical protein CGQ24_11935 [Arthrobacter sp. 7749]|nr:hypothetical protein CGQ24_11935 [Arthrobacter sp. 7749]
MTVYPNCSMGGMTTVYKNRIAQNPDQLHHLLFMNDRGAQGVFDPFSNARVDILEHGRLQPYAVYSASMVSFDEVRVTSLPKVANALMEVIPNTLVYEFHSSSEKVIQDEIDQLNLELLPSVIVPSNFLAELVISLLPTGCKVPVTVVPNVVDNRIFWGGKDSVDWNFAAESIPLLWIGRFDKGKNPRDFLRALSQLPEKFIGVFIVSMESTPERAASFLADVAAYGLDDRIHVMMNLAQDEIASMYRFAASVGGMFVSTSLGESFGYGVAEALACGLNTVAYDVGALAEREAPPECSYVLVDVGDICGLTEAIASLGSV